jgi:VWFA-related protein
MSYPAVFLFLAAGVLPAHSQDSPVVFRSDVSLVRVDTQVVDGRNRPIAGLNASDFILRDEGQTREIRNFDKEDLPIDVVLLFDVSASMRPHIQRIASAAGNAMTVLRDQDRLAIMVFDRGTRLRLGFRDNRAEVERELRRMLRDEEFNGGTDITRGLLDAADYVRQEARANARRAIIIVTDDETERDRDEAGVSRALTRANAVLCALIAPDAMHTGRRRDDDAWSRGGWGGIVFGRRGGYSGRVYGGGTHSAGTEEIARDSGGDSMPVDEASSLESTMARIRQMYALNFYMPPDIKPNQQRSVQVELTAAARSRFPGAELRYRKTYIAPGSAAASTDAPQQQSGGWRKIK